MYGGASGSSVQDETKEGQDGEGAVVKTIALPVEALVDVYCEAPVQKAWKDLADSAVDRTVWGDVGYYFVMGACIFFYESERLSLT